MPISSIDVAQNGLKSSGLFLLSNRFHSTAECRSKYSCACHVHVGPNLYRFDVWRFSNDQSDLTYAASVTGDRGIVWWSKAGKISERFWSSSWPLALSLRHFRARLRRTR
jgi:hypothetical protein